MVLHLLASSPRRHRRLTAPDTVDASDFLGLCSISRPPGYPVPRTGVRCNGAAVRDEGSKVRYTFADFLRRGARRLSAEGIECARRDKQRSQPRSSIARPGSPRDPFIVRTSRSNFIPLLNHMNHTEGYAIHVYLLHLRVQGQNVGRRGSSKTVTERVDSGALLVHHSLCYALPSYTPVTTRRGAY